MSLANDINYLEYPICNFCNSNDHKILMEKVNNTLLNIVECNDCGLRFYSPRVKLSIMLDKGFGSDMSAKESADKLRKNFSFFAVEDPEKQKKGIESYYIDFLNRIKNYHRSKEQIESVFEVGGGIGMFLSAARKFGIITIHGCDMNKWYVEAGQVEFGLKNYEISIFNEYSSKRKYDLIVMLDFIEHTYTPMEDLEKANKMLNVGGIIFLKTFLDYNGINTRMIDPIGHMYHFKEDVLRKMLGTAGFSMIKCESHYIDQVLFYGKKVR